VLPLPLASYRTLTSRDRTTGRGSCAAGMLRGSAGRVIVRAIRVGATGPPVRGAATIPDLRTLAELHGRTLIAAYVGP